jgi:capsular exopolysaccharide synthesis family protein
MEALPPAAFDPIAEASPREYGRILLRRKWVVVIALLLAAIGSTLYTWQAPRVYAAASKVYVRKPDGFLTPAEFTLYSGQINPNTQIALIKTRPVIERAVSRLKSVSVDAVMGALRVDLIPSTELIEIGVHWSDPVMARDIANAVAQAFVEHRTSVARKSQQETLAFLDRTLKQAKEDLTRSETSLQRFQERTAFTGSSGRLAPGQQEQVDRLASRRGELINAEIDHAMAEIELKHVSAQLAEQKEHLARRDPDAVRDNELLHQTRSELSAKRAELARARASLTPEGVARFHPGLAEQVADLERQLSRQFAAVAGSGVDLEAHQKLLASRDVLAAQVRQQAERVTRLREAVAALNTERQRLPALAREYSRLLLDKEANEKMYTLLRQKQKETEISRVSQLGNAEKVESAVAQPVPVWPRPRQNLAFALAFGLMLGIAAAFLFEFLDDSLATPEDVERYLHLPTLGSIPMIREPEFRLLSHVNPRSGLAEGYRMIRSSVAFTSVDEPLRTLMVTSAGPGEGKSMMAANLAIVHAQKGIRVLLVDCDLRRPSQQKLFNLNGSVGFTNLVLGTATAEQAAQDVGVENLRVIASGPLPPNPAEMLESGRARQVMAELEELADLVIYDTPPCVALSDPIVLAACLGGVLLVIESGETPRNAAAQAVYHLAAAKSNLLGVILNKVDLRREGYHTYYYQQQYYRSYFEDEGAADSAPSGKTLLATDETQIDADQRSGSSDNPSSSVSHLWQTGDFPSDEGRGVGVATRGVEAKGEGKNEA